MSISTLSYQYIFNGTRLNIRPHYQQPLAELGLAENTDWQSFADGEIISLGATTCIKVFLPAINEYVYFKRYVFKNHKWRFFLRTSKAATELLNYQHIKNIGIPTLDVIGLYEQRTFGRLNIACIITKEIPNTIQLDNFYQNVLLKMPLTKQKVVLTSIQQNLFHQLKLAHSANFFHLDLKWRNILIDLNDDSYTPIWIDCPRGKQSKILKYKNKVADLSALARKGLSFFTTQQLYRMLLMYLGKEKTRQEARKLFSDISSHLSRRPPKIN